MNQPIDNHEFSGLEPQIVPGPTGPGGAPTCYMIYAHDAVLADPETIPLLVVPIQQGSITEGTNGVLDMTLLALLIHIRESYQNGPYPSPEGHYALHHLRQAMLWINERTRQRQRRGVFDKQVK